MELFFLSENDHDNFHTNAIKVLEEEFKINNSGYLEESIISDFKKKFKERRQRKKDEKDVDKVIVETEWSFTSFSGLYATVFWSLRSLNRGISMGSTDMHKAPIFVNEFDKLKNSQKREIRLTEESYNDIIRATASSGEDSLVAMFMRMKKDAIDRYKEMDDSGKRRNKGTHDSYIQAMDFLAKKIKTVHGSYKSGMKGKVGEIK